MDNIPFKNNINHLSITIENNNIQPWNLKKYKSRTITNVIIGLRINKIMSNFLCLTKFRKLPNKGVIKNNKKRIELILIIF